VKYTVPGNVMKRCEVVHNKMTFYIEIRR